MNESATALATTPLTSWHNSHNGRMAAFAGYSMPIQYSSIVTEHNATRTAAGLFDISHMGRLRFEGDRAAELLDHLITRNVMTIPVGGVRYSLMCNTEGGILDDVLVSRLETPSGKQFFMLVVNASNREKILKWMQPHLADFPDVRFNDVTDSTAMISIQGPKAVEIASKLFPSKVVELKYYRSLVTDQMNKPCVVSRTGYTGEDGFELIVKSDDAVRVWENLTLAGRDLGIEPVGLGARDTLRLEAGMPLYGHELSEDIDPFTAGLGFAVNLTRKTDEGQVAREFLGSEALRVKREQSPQSVRIGLKLEGRRAAREGAALVDRDNRQIGEVTSGTFSPSLGAPIAMAYASPEAATVGTTIDVDIRGSKTNAEFVELPFYKRDS